MLIEDRLTDPADRRKAIEQAQKAVARVSDLANESSRLAAWIEQPQDASQHIDARALIDGVIAAASDGASVTADVDIGPSAGAIATANAEALAQALIAVTKATARELRNAPCAIAARLAGATALDLRIGLADQFAALGDGPGAADAAPLTVERGGVGLSLVYAAAVLASHGATAWTANGSRSTVGIRLPIGERALQ